ncbi:enoyl-CoA hydratase-related protein [Photobacterium sp. SDRW27]|uniref:enoyl-CoA hydratase-related protein n=1 Tax=Photobacterium obscurum TaxID=2829490 RepID=UPI00224467AE|nr:enoyl-CoA hydratase-related protein [Photobacterium obscurum]MCW8329300.1 enoyl-CoA hydratase-related protein [Photobacterium obscurum]
MRPTESQCSGLRNQNTDTENLHTSPEDDVLCTVTKSGIATLALNRINKHNAFDANVIQTLNRYLLQLKQRADIRVLILTANGKHFSAGADLNWMKSMAEKSVDENHEDATRLANLLSELDNFPTPTIAHIHGSAFGGALGLICCCDIAIATAEAQFCLSEVRLGLIPATIGPYVCRTIGQRQARRYMLTAERFDSSTAQQLGIIHEVRIRYEETQQLLTHFISQLLSNSPQALTQAKALCQLCDNHKIDTELKDTTSSLIAEIRVSPHGQEGLKAFFDKRPPAWSAKHE